MKKNNKGFSLVELIIVIAIMAVLIGLLAPQYLRFVEKSKKSSDITNAQSLATAYNVAFADGKITSGTYGGAAGASDTTANVVLPEGKFTSGNWSIVVGADGVSSVTLGDKALYPTPDSSYK